jgi:hypothetical protein
MPTAAENIANKGYGALKVQTDKDTPVTPNVFFPLYKDSLGTDINADEDSPILGQRMKIYQTFMGMRKHMGALEVLAEPNTAEYWFDMLLKAGTITGANPYTHPYTLDIPPNAYTVDLLKGQLVERYWGIEAEDIEPVYDKNLTKFSLNVGGRGSFIVREIATVSTVTITLKTDYDPAPNKGLVAGDLVRVMKADGSTILDTTVSSVNADGITVVLGGSAAAYAAGDYIFLRAQSVSTNTLDPFLWARTEHRFADTAANALTATQTRLEQGTKWKIAYPFNKKEGEDRSGSFDPAGFPRLLGEAQVSAKVFFDQPQDLNRFLKLEARACVIRMFSGSNKELRITLNSLRQKASKRPLETGKLVYNDIGYEANYNASDGQGLGVSVINAVAT